MRELEIVVLGLVWGSFLNMCGHRLLSGDSLLKARSFCPHCRRAIPFYDLIPVLSYLFLGGRCRQCHASISLLYPFIEVATAIAGLALWSDLGWGYFVFEAADIWRATCYGVLLSGFIIAMRTDLEALVVPRVVTLLMALVGIAGVCGGVLPIPPLQAAGGALLGYGGFWLLNRLAILFLGREGVGEGDMELFAVIGLFFGPLGVWGVTFLSSLLGTAGALSYLALTGQGRYTRIPFIPFITSSLIAYLFLQRELIAWLWAV